MSLGQKPLKSKLFSLAESGAALTNGGDALNLTSLAHYLTFLEQSTKDLTKAVEETSRDISKMKKQGLIPSLQDEIHGLQKAVEVIEFMPDHSNSAFDTVITTRRLERSINSCEKFLSKRYALAKELQSEIDDQTAYYNDLKQLKNLLESRIDGERSPNVRGPDELVDAIKVKATAKSQLAKELLISLRNLVNHHLAPILLLQERGIPITKIQHMAFDEEDEAECRALAKEFRADLENLLNTLFDEEELESYVTLADPNGATARLLLRSEVIVADPDDSSRVRLRNFNEFF